MICHRQFNDGHSPATYIGGACIGSRCAMWVPAVTLGDGKDGLFLAAPFIDAGGEHYHHEDDEHPTGRGLCADNLRATPWADPGLPDGEG